MSSKPLSGKVAIITGGSKGIGRSTAIRLAKDGASVAINYASDPAAANELIKEIGADHAIAIQADAGSIDGAEKIVNETVRHFGRIDIVIPNAGVLPMKDLQGTTEEDFDKTFNLNVKGPYFLCQVSDLHLLERHFLFRSPTRLSVIRGSGKSPQRPSARFGKGEAA